MEKLAVGRPWPTHRLPFLCGWDHGRSNWENPDDNALDAVVRRTQHPLGFVSLRSSNFLRLAAGSEDEFSERLLIPLAASTGP